MSDLEFERVIRSTNGEDVLYVFHAREAGRSLLLPYNVIRKAVAVPMPCHGYSLFDDGKLRGRQSADQARRWTEVKAGHLRRMAMGGGEDDPFTRAVAAVGLLADRVGGVEAAIDRATTSR